MNQPDSRLLELYQRYIDGSFTEEERREFMDLVKQDEKAHAFHQLIDQSYDNGPVDQEITTERSEEIFRTIIGEQATAQRRAPVHRVHFLRRWWAAACILLLLMAGGYWYLKSGKEQPPIVQVEKPAVVQPGKDGAVLTLADGSKLVLDSLGNGVVTTQNGTNVVLNNGQLAYEHNNKNDNAPVWNTMSTPKGRQFQLLLPDGTKVYLNAASTLTYPTLFTGKERRVQVTGEAWFEVAKDPAMPFKVKINEGPEVEVLGTHFNINAYSNEAAIKTTLVEGSVKISTVSGQSSKLKPGEQAVMLTHSSMTINHSADIDKVTAWRKGIFDFNDMGLREMMRQIERWYDIDVAYEGNVPDVKFFGKTSRSVNLSTVLEALDGFGLHYRMEGRKLIVTP